MALSRDELIQQLIDADVPEDDIKNILRGTAGAPMSPGEEIAMRETPVENVQEATWYDKYLRPAVVIGSTMLGGQLGNIGKVGSKMVFNAGQPAWKQMLGEAAGGMFGDVVYQAGREAATGEPIRPAESLRIGGMGLAGSATTRGVAELGAIAGGVKTFAMREAGRPTAGIVPSYQRTFGSLEPKTVAQVRAGVSRELSIADDVGLAIREASKNTSAQRLQKESILRQADAGGVRVPAGPIVEELERLRMEVAGSTEQSAMTLHNQIQDWKYRLINKAQAQGGTFAPTEIDRFIRKELSPKAFTASGDPATSRMGQVVLAVRQKANETLNGALPSGIRELNEKITGYLDSVEDAEKLFGADRQSRAQNISGAFEPNREIIAQTLSRFSDVAKTLPSFKGRNLSQEAMDIATKREFTQDIRGAAGPGVQGFAGRPQRTGMAAVGVGVAKVFAPLQSFGAPAASAWQAYMERRRRKEQPNP